MKKLFLVLSLALISVGAMAMSRSKIRTHARFLTDRMAYELDFTPMQYDDCYEINYDFIYAVERLMDDVVFGYVDAINRYYTYLDYRNEDLRYIMTNRQYMRFLASDYFYRPIYSTGSTWNFRVYRMYSNRTFFYFDAPISYKSYRGGHSRTMNPGYFHNRYSYQTDRYTGNPHIHGNAQFDDHRRHDFGINLKERQGTTYNNYKNPNSSNRTDDHRYRDNSGNQNSPSINNRSQSTTGRRGTTTTSSSSSSRSGSGTPSSRSGSSTSSSRSSSSRSAGTTTSTSTSRSGSSSTGTSSTKAGRR